MSNDIDKHMIALLQSIENSDDEYKKFIDKSNAKVIISCEENDTFTKEFRDRETKHKQIEKGSNKRAILRSEEGKIWSDSSLAEWPENDYRIHVRNIPITAFDEDLYEAFKHFKSLAKVKVIRDSSGRSRQYGFISFLDVNDYIEAMKTMDGTLIQKRRIKLMPSKWKSKSIKDIE